MEAPPRPGRFIRLLVLAVVLTNLAAGLLGWSSLQDGRRHAEELARQTTRNLVQVLDESLASSGRTMDVMLRALAAELERLGRQGRVSDDEVVALLARYQGWLPEAEGLRVFDADGNSRWSFPGGLPVALNVSDRDYFTAVRDDPQRGMYVSRPLFSRITKGWVITFARRLKGPDGGFAGVLTAVVPLDHFSAVLARPQLGAGGTALLRYDDLSLVSRHPALPGSAGEVGSREVAAEFGVLVAAGLAGTRDYLAGMPGGGAQISAVRHVNGLPFLVELGMNSADYLAEWRRDCVHTAVLLGVFLLVTAGSARVTGRLYRRQQHNTLRLSDSNARLSSALQELRDRDQALGAAEQIAGLGIYSIDLASQVSRNSSRLKEIFGLPASQDFGLGEWRELLHPDDREAIVEAFVEGLIRHGRTFDRVYRLIRPDGELRWIHGIGRLQRDAAAQPVSVHGAVQDITERTRAEASLQEALDEYEKLVARIPVGVFKHRVDCHGRMSFIYVSPRFCEQLGLTVKAVLADAAVVLRCIHPDDQPAFQARFQAVLAHPQPFEWEGRVRVGDVLRWVSVMSRPTILGNGEMLWEGVQTDVTDRKLAEIALRASEARYRLLLQHSPVGILHYDNELNVSYCNLQFAQIMDVPHSYMLSLNCGKLKDVRVRRALCDALDGHFGQYEGPYVTTYAGRELNIAMNCAPVRDEAGNITGGIAILQDITERVLKDRELARYRDSLEERVAERTADLEAARAEAERLARVKSEFLANMSHEIRTPLNGVLGLAHIGFRESHGRSHARETFARILSSGQLLLGIINDILDFSKIEAGKLRVEAIPVDPGKLIGETLALMTERACAKGLALHFRRSSALPASCLTDPLRIGQILLNLLSNAIKFTARGSVTLVAGHEDGQLVFQVIDTGIGMCPTEIAKVFAPFEQADNSTTRRFGGTGLGLTITQRIVELMGGTLRAESRPDCGSQFEVRVPAAVVSVPAGPAAVCEAPEAEQGQPGGRLAGIPVLVAEDNEVNRLVIESLLQDEGAVVSLASNGQEAVDCVRQRGAEAFRIVLMDVQMPVMDGYAATREILALAPDLPVIGQTAHAFDEERQHCFEAGMVDHLPKPIDPEQMVRIILRHLSVERNRSYLEDSKIG